MRRVLVVGSINMDLMVRCVRAPRAGETVHGVEFRTAGGGKGANQAVACSRLGAETHMIGRVGDDAFGAELRRALKADGVEVSGVMVDQGVATGVALIVVEEGGENRIVIVPGANGRLGDREVERARQVMGQVDAVLMPLEVPLPVVKAVAEAARKQGVLCVLDAGAATAAAVEMGLPALVDVISPNESEAEALTGMPVRSLEEARSAAQRLRDPSRPGMGAREVVIKLGDQGAYWLGPEGEAQVPAFPIQPVDTTAAGDAFTACLTVALAEGRPMPEAIRRANAAGALACLKLGAQPSMPTATEVESFLAERDR